MKIAAYCRVSTDKSDQLNSLEAQKEFFAEYTHKNGHELVRLYADEGISGTKTKNRKEFLLLLREAQEGLFDMVVVKDISRFARNTVDFLQSIRSLKALGIETIFLTANQTVLGNSEFILTIFGALAQEESANMSKRVKFGKKINAQKGRVPNIVYGYDKISGDYYNLSINQKEKAVVQRIYDLYTNHGYGANKISQILNSEGEKTKRGYRWSQNAISRILSNELYTGIIINGKEEVEDFLTGVRKKNDESKWHIVERMDLKIIEPDVFDKAQRILKSRIAAFNVTKERQSNKHLFSTIIKCGDCGYSFRRTVNQYTNTYIRWVCSGRNARGTDSCNNRTKIDEQELMDTLQAYFINILSNKSNFSDRIVKKLSKTLMTGNERFVKREGLQISLGKLKNIKQKYINLYTDDIISLEELKQETSDLNIKIEQFENELKFLAHHINKADRLDDVLQETFKTIEDIVSVSEMNNAQLKRIVKHIEVDTDGTVDIYLHRLNGSGFDHIGLISDSHTQRCDRKTRKD